MPDLVFGHFEGTELPPAVGRFHQQPVAVVDLGTEVVGSRMGALTVPEHRREGRDAKLLHGTTQGQLGLDVHRRDFTGRDCEAIGARDTFALEEGLGHE